MNDTYFTSSGPLAVRGIDKAISARKGIKSCVCKLCGEDTGATTQCGTDSCFTAFHVTCAVSRGCRLRSTPVSVSVHVV